MLLSGILIVLMMLLSKGGKDKKSGEISLIQQQLQRLTQTLDTKLSENTRFMTENMSKTFATSAQINENSTRHIEAITRKLTELGESNKQIQEIGGQLRWLENILKNPKQRGNLWEYFLKELLENVFTSEQYALQFWLSTWVVDAALFLGGRTIPIDAKFPQENYKRLIESEDELSQKKYSHELKKDIKQRIDEVAKYILPEEDTTDFAFMLIPAEWLYYDIFIAKVGGISASSIIEYGFSKKVIICSPSGFYAYLQTVLQGMKSLQIEKHAQEIQQYVLKLQKDLKLYEEIFQKLGSSLHHSVQHYNTAGRRLWIIEKDILKINPQSENILEAQNEIEAPEKF